MLSLQSDSPSSGTTNLMSGLSNWAWITSPDQASQATMLPGGEVLDVLVAGEGADLAGVDDDRCSLSMALSHSSSVKLLGSAPMTLSMKPIVSRISESSVILPLRSERVSSSSKLPTSSVFVAL